MNLGAEPKKLAVLGVLLLAAGYSVYTNMQPDLPPGARQQSAKRPEVTSTVPGLPSPPPPAQRKADDRTVQRRKSFGPREAGEFKPRMKYDKAEDRPDPLKVDPTLRTDILAKLQKVSIEVGARSLFEMGAKPPDPVITVGPNRGSGGGGKNAGGATTASTAAPKPVEPPKPAGDVKPQAPPIPLKFYGFTTPRAGGAKRAFFLEGEEIYVAAEGETIKKRYKVVRVGVNSVVMEDTQFNQQQTLPLEEPPVTG